MRTNKTTEVSLNPGLQLNTMTCKDRDDAYGISFLPWDTDIQLSPPPASMFASPNVVGVIPISNRLVPVFDLRTESWQLPQPTADNTALLMISTANKHNGSMAVAILIQAENGHLRIPIHLIEEFVSRN